MNESELEDIESHLYSQIYHSNDHDEEHFVAPSEKIDMPRTAPGTDRPGRYFQTAFWGSKPTKNPYQKQCSPRPVVRKNHEKSQGFYSKNCASPYKPDLAINQLVVLGPQNAVLCTSPKEVRKARWKAKLKEKRKRKQAAKLANKFKQLDRLMIFKSAEVITLSDSDEESCVIVDNSLPHVSMLESEHEAKLGSKENNVEEQDNTNVASNAEEPNNLNESISDDVIFVEPVKAPVVVIDIDEESNSSIQTNKTDTSAAKITLNSPAKSDVSNSPTKAKTQTPKELQQERRELLSTPDSASNDFINSSGIELNKEKFNFSLHGSDFHSDFLKPANRNETCETESSSSTTDVNTVNVINSSVFNEIEFPKDDIFSENNLETFGKFITPLRRQATVDVTAQSSPKPSDAQHQNVYSSDSSSEGDFEESQVDKQKDVSRKTKNLPELSPMQVKSNKSNQQVKKSKKLIDVGTKHDLLKTTVSKQVTQKSSGKKKKNKKKSISMEDAQIEDTYLDGESEEIEISNNLVDKGVEPNEIKQKKRRSSQMDNTLVNLEGQSNKKMRTRKKRSDRGDNADKTDSEVVSSIQNLEENEEAAEKATDDALSKDKSDHVIAEGVDKTRETVERQADRETKPQETLIQDSNVSTSQEGAMLNSNIVATTPEECREKISEEGNVENNVEKLGKEKCQSNEQQRVKTPLDGLVVVDETFASEFEIIASSDSESILSHLEEVQDIQLINCKAPRFQDKNTPSTSKSSIELKDCSVQELQSVMSDDPKLWAILDIDRMPYRASTGRRCNRCKEVGHMAIRCPNRVEAKCRLCGESGHYEPRCPNKLCTQCGQRSHYSTTYCKSCFKLRSYRCSLCSMTGHLTTTCPDLWRRYYLTTSEGPIKVYNGPALKSKEQLWCSGCAQSGHLEHACTYYGSVYPPADPFIKSYEDVYQDRPVQSSQQEQQPIAPNHASHGDSPTVDKPRYMPTYTYDQTNVYAQRNLFAPNQNFHYNAPRHMIQYPPRGFTYDTRNDYTERYDQNNFEDNLPNYISFESGLDQQAYNQVPVAPPEESYLNSYGGPPKEFLDVDKMDPRRHRYLFFSLGPEDIQKFLGEELSRLTKLSYHIDKSRAELKRKQFQRNVSGNHYQKLNMMLFGVLNLNDGKTHLERLKKFKRTRLRSKLPTAKRQQLYKSYCYIFGLDKHDNVNYNKLLNRI